MDNRWFPKAKLGIFIHYGIYAVKGVAESWSFYNGRIGYEEYMEQLEGFYADQFDASVWADLIVRSGARYAVLTAKHHDGVALFDTHFSDLSVAKKTPAKRDIVKEFAEEIQARGLHLGIYYSLSDWSHPDYAAVFKEGGDLEDPANTNPFTAPINKKEDPQRWQQFLKFNNNQLKELLTGYGSVDLLWLDGDWERSASQWGLPGFRDYLKSFNPDLVINSRIQGYGDYQTPEQGIPIIRPEGDWEFCTTINSSWGYQPEDHHYKSLNQIIRMFCDCISMGGNMLLNIGPRQDGTIDSRQEAVLSGLGYWIREHEEAVYDTEEGIMPCYYAGGSTVSSDRRTLYLFVYDNPKEAVCLKGLCNPITKVSVLHSGKKLCYEIHGGVPWFGVPGTTWIQMTERDCHKNVTVVRVELEGEIKMYGNSKIAAQAGAEKEKI